MYICKEDISSGKTIIPQIEWWWILSVLRVLRHCPVNINNYCRRCHKRVALNVGGVRHEVTWRLLDQFPQSRLGRLARAETHQEISNLVSDYNLLQNEYFFDRQDNTSNIPPFKV